MEWNQLKKRLLDKLEEEGADQEVIPYLDLVNSVPSLVTSSSCYGRILLIDLPDDTKKHANFLFKTHQPVSFKDAWKALEECAGQFVWFKADPLILHVSCQNLETTEKLLRAKARAGMKRGGVFSIARERWQIELEGTYRMSVPVKKGEELLVNQDYFHLLVKEANKKMKKNQEMWKRFAREFKKEFPTKS
jgi:tRNA wybutosine-synthesizing protein 3